MEVLTRSLKHPFIILPGLLCVCSAALAQPFAGAAGSLSRYADTGIRPTLSCRDLRDLELHELLEIHAEEVRANGATPAFCKVSGVLDPEIAFEVDLPSNWNGRFYMTGNGGHAGQRNDDPFQIAGRNSALQQGFAAATTNTGHNADEEPGATFVLSNPQKAIDYAYRAVHLTAVTTKAITNLYYGQPVSHAYWNSCSNGGRQGLVEAQRYPGDFDGIVANAPWVSQPALPSVLSGTSVPWMRHP
jgi:feruloyl esterase